MEIQIFLNQLPKFFLESSFYSIIHGKNILHKTDPKICYPEFWGIILKENNLGHNS
jgi:hypothetical protein